MGNRLSAIATRTGDDGTTGLGDGSRVRKDALRVQAMGDVDELNSTIGLLLTEVLPDEVGADLFEIQHDLFDLGGELSIPGFTLLKIEQVARLDERLAYYNEPLPPLKEFILPGGSRTAALAHVARTVCRRAERSVVTLAIDENINDAVKHYLNRLSDLLFVLSRTLNRVGGGNDVLWRSQRNAAQS
jgi:cob(I)alamin adenosyltransferase